MQIGGHGEQQVKKLFFFFFFFFAANDGNNGRPTREREKERPLSLSTPSASSSSLSLLLRFTISASGTHDLHLQQFTIQHTKPQTNRRPQALFVAPLALGHPARRPRPVARPRSRGDAQARWAAKYGGVYR